MPSLISAVRHNHDVQLIPINIKPKFPSHILIDSIGYKLYTADYIFVVHKATVTCCATMNQSTGISR